MLEIGMKAPEFSLPDQNGQMHKLSDYKGQKVILYFYPADMSPGCTNQACSFFFFLTLKRKSCRSMMYGKNDPCLASR